MNATKTGRNHPCHCGSGKKFKQCCLRSAPAIGLGTPVAGVEKAAVQGLIPQALAHQRAGQLPQAAAIYQQILREQPEHPDALHLLGLIAHQNGQLDIAVELIGAAIRVKPSGPMHYNLALALQARGQTDAAIANYAQAIVLNPADARAHSNLGALLQGQDRLEDAVLCYRSAIALNPQDAGAHGNLGVALCRQGQMAAAVASFERAIALNPADAASYNNLGNVQRDLEKLDAAQQNLEKAIALQPGYVQAHNNLGNVLQDQGRTDAALASFRTALAFKPDDAATRWNESLALLMAGRLREGWAQHEWRLRQPENMTGYRNLLAGKPLYAGEDLTGKTILVWAEQGVGDELFFAGVLSDVVRAAGHCVIECDPRLVPLYARSFPGAEVIPKCDPPHPRTQQADIDWQLPVGSLPRWFRTGIDSFPKTGGYLRPDPQRIAFWRERFAALGDSPKVGITWRSMRRSASRDLHYSELAQWGPLLQVKGVTFINLQYDECRAELAAARERFGVEIHQWDDLDQMNDLDEVAAMMAALDLVIAPTTTPAILAGAIGAPVWMLLTRHITWKTLGTGGIPMFPSLRALWRERGVAWDTVLQSTAVELRNWQHQQTETLGEALCH